MPVRSCSPCERSLIRQVELADAYLGATLPTAVTVSAPPAVAAG